MCSSDLLQDAERRIGEVRRAETRRLQKVKAKREKLAAKEAMEPVSLPTNTKVEETHEEFEHPDDLLKTLKRELHFEQTHHIGPMYPGVFKKLEFRRPKANVKKKKEKAHNHDPVSLFQAAAANNDAVNSLQATVTNHDPANVFKAAAAFQELGSVFQVAVDDTMQLEAEEGAASVANQEDDASDSSLDLFPHGDVLPIVDVGALIDEVNSGRYPSMKLDPTRKQEKKCYICKSGGGKDLTPCSFCSKLNHFKCLRTRFLCKAPEPVDHFMCNHCIQCILARRIRAEKRRLAKLCRRHETVLTQAKTTAKLTKKLIVTREYECVAAQGQRMNDLKELLGEAGTRLSLLASAAKMNRIRRSMIHDAGKIQNEIEQS